MTHQAMDIENLYEVKKCLIEAFKHEVNNGISNMNYQDAMGMADMIKDLACAEKDCLEAKYYKSVVKAMEEYGENPRMGYNPPMRDYTPSYYNSPIRDMNYRSRSQYYDDNDSSSYDRNNYRNNYNEDDENEREYGRTFNNFRKAKKHYTQTHSPEDQQRMKEQANRHLSKTIGTFKEIWGDADPDLRRKMKTDLTNLVNEMAV